MLSNIALVFLLDAIDSLANFDFLSWIDCSQHLLRSRLTGFIAARLHGQTSFAAKHLPSTAQESPTKWLFVSCVVYMKNQTNEQKVC